MRARFAGWILIGCLAGAAAAAPASAQQPGVRVVSSAVDAQPFDVDGYRVSVSASAMRAGQSRICVDAMQTIDTSTSTTAIGQSGCLDGVAYTFDPIEWVATVSGQIRVDVTVYRCEPARECRAASMGRAPVRFELGWTGRGLVYPAVDAGLCGYRLIGPPNVWAASVGSSRDAVVSGYIDFDGVGLHADVPADHPGTMSWN